MAEDPSSSEPPLGGVSRLGQRSVAHALRIAQVGSWEWDVAADRVVWSDELYRIYGVDPGTPMDHERCFEPVHPEDRERVKAATDELLRTGQPVRFDLRIVRPDGSVRALETWGEAVREGGGTHLFGVCQDVTERKLLEGQLRQAQKMEAVGRLAGGVAHDFNNLLTTVIGFSDLVLAGLPADSPIRADLEEIRRAGERAADLTRQLLAFSRQQLVEMRSLDPNVVVREVDKMLRRLIGEDVELVLHLDPDVGVVRGDAGQLEQVLVNLALNARDAMPQGGRLTIETSRAELEEPSANLATTVPPGRYSVISVADTGTGIDAETLKHIFEPFYTTKERGKGTGLGLATVYGIVKQSGGYIHVTSAPREGSVFEIFLPEADGLVDPRPTPPPLRIRAGAGETVLLVEDEPSVKLFASRVLSQLGYTVLVAENGQEALRLEARHEGPIHVLLTDWVMPGLRGDELAAAMRPRRPGVKVIYMSGYAREAYERHGVLEPGVPLLRKPLTAGVLAAQVRKVLDR